MQTVFRVAQATGQVTQQRSTILCYRTILGTRRRVAAENGQVGRSTRNHGKPIAEDDDLLESKSLTVRFESLSGNLMTLVPEWSCFVRSKRFSPRICRHFRPNDDTLIFRNDHPHKCVLLFSETTSLWIAGTIFSLNLSSFCSR